MDATRPMTKTALSVLLLAMTLLACAGCGPLFMKDIATDALDPNNLADTEPSIAVNPVNPNEISIVAFSETWTLAKGAPVWKSRDHGVTWNKIWQITDPGAGFFGPDDQKIDYDANGNIYVAEIGFGAAATDFILRQGGGPDAPLSPGAAYGDDQPHLALDRSSGSPHRGRLYSPWLNFNVPLTQSTVAWSPNQGITINSVAVGNNSKFPNRTTRIAIAPNGMTYVVYKIREGTVAANPEFENVHFTVNRSDDGGVTWNGVGAAGVSVHGLGQVQTYMTNTFGNVAKGKVARARSSDAWIAVDPSNSDVYVAYVSRDTSGFAQIYVARSTDRGATWVSNRVTNGRFNSAYPEIAVTISGAVGVMYIDYDDSGAATLFRHHLAQSFNRGFGWNDQMLQSMDPGPIANASSGFLWGDYEGLVADQNTFYGVFTGESTGRTVLQLDPIFFRQKSCNWWWLICWISRN